MLFRNLCLAVATLFVAAPAVAAETRENPNHWLHNAADDRARFDRLQQQAGGFSQAMWEVGERYRVIHDAVGRGNHDLALYHWDKIADAIRRGYERRPGRQANSDKLFLDAAWPEVRRAFESGESDALRSGFERARGACLACHIAEDVGYMNDQALFELRGR